MDSSMPGSSVLYYLPEFAQIHVHWVTLSNHLILCQPLSPFAFTLSQYQDLFQWVDSSHQAAKVLGLQLQHQSCEWILRVDFLQDWLVWSSCSPQTLKSLLQHHNSKASILWCLAFFMVRLSHLYITTGKTIALTMQIFGSKVMFLLLNMPSRFATAFIPRSKCLNFMAVVTICSDFWAPQNKIWHYFHCFPIYLSWSDGTRCLDLRFWMLTFKSAFFTLLFNFHQGAL